MNDAQREAVVQEIKAIWKLTTVEPTRVITTGWGEPGHPIMIGPRHVTEASKYHGGVLGQAVIDKFGCDNKVRGQRCTYPASDHKEEIGLLVTLTADVTEKDLSNQLMEIKPLLEQHGLAGVGFGGVDKHRVLKEDGTVLLGPGAKGRAKQ